MNLLASSSGTQGTGARHSRPSGYSSHAVPGTERAVITKSEFCFRPPSKQLFFFFFWWIPCAVLSHSSGNEVIIRARKEGRGGAGYWAIGLRKHRRSKIAPSQPAPDIKGSGSQRSGAEAGWSVFPAPRHTHREDEVRRGRPAGLCCLG